MLSLTEKMNEVHELNVEKGWFESNRTFGDDMALLHSEVSEALEAFRDGGTDDQTKDRDKANDFNPKPEGVGSEFADVLIRLLDSCFRYGVNLEYEYGRKMHYNRTRTHRHGGRTI